MQVKVHSEWMLIVWCWLSWLYLYCESSGISDFCCQSERVNVASLCCCQASSALYCCRCEYSLYHTITSLIPGTLLSACLYLSLSLSRRALVGKPCGNSGSNSVAILKCFTKTKHFILPLFSDGMMLDERQKQAKERREERAKYLGKTVRQHHLLSGV